MEQSGGKGFLAGRKKPKKKKNVVELNLCLKEYIVGSFYLKSRRTSQRSQVRKSIYRS